MPISLSLNRNRLKPASNGRRLTPPYVVIDYPQEREVIKHPFYSIRIGAEGGVTVEVAIDSGVWQRCRPAAGYWWHDWGFIAPGRHTLVARVLASSGRTRKTKARTCRASF